MAMGENNATEDTLLLGNSRRDSSSAETTREYRSRWLSIRIMYLTMFVASIGFSLVVTSIWPYFKSVERNADTTFLGWLVAAYSLGQFVASPIFGLCSNYLPTKVPLSISLVVGIAANILYAFAGSFASNSGTIMLIARIGVGVSAGNIAVVRSYSSGSTTLKERTPAMANLSAAQALGFILGPVVQTAFAPVGERGVDWDAIKLRVNMYTIPALLSAALGLVNLVLVLGLFRHHHVPDIDQSKTTTTSTTGFIDKTAVLFCNIIFFIILFVFSLNETIGTPLSMDMYAWDSQHAVFYTGLILGVGSVVAMAMFMLLKPLAKRFDERKILFGGVLLMFIGFLLDIPWPWTSVYPPRPYTTLNSTINDTLPILHNATSPTRGCLWTVTWCDNTHMIYLPQYLTSAFFLASGYPASTVMSFTIYSKVLGPSPQGVYMGLLTSSGSLARTLGPVTVSQLYAKYGPTWTFLSVTVFLLLTLIGLVIVYRRLIPFVDRTRQLVNVTSVN
ncbi:major facilitator superfamily domain-containing protein 8-like [Saccoglossus kowalevskii]